ncbi:hypothetical protein SH668x_001072 [Planctomicrobium sp. SH668]|uniref:hypothetical protein n=1 Tax=Planctomicrobium sp. SH668 TaxID=3448126 RepID=UPI003F5BCB42
MKACGFILDHRAQILDVSETTLRVRLGQKWFEPPLQGNFRKKPMEVRIAIKPYSQTEDPHAIRKNSCTDNYWSVTVSIRPLSSRWNSNEFTAEAKRIMMSLRSYFMAT